MDNDNGGVTEPHIERFCGYGGDQRDKTGNKVELQHYLTNPSVDCLVHYAGGDATRPQQHRPGWSTVPVTDTMVDILVRGLNAEVLKVQAAAYDADINVKEPHKELQEDRLYCAQGSVGYIKVAIIRFIQMAAAR